MKRQNTNCPPEQRPVVGKVPSGASAGYSMFVPDRDGSISSGDRDRSRREKSLKMFVIQCWAEFTCHEDRDEGSVKPAGG
ncbi:Hypothetical protein NTJ_07020 [Nesidiocoris tenuis]|uniref:Uncharacterized protein n=1 Tax=Nesidiocoris tenuis TaxID=355587 RepID=A0ABN7APR3_9HEMI|nr:Hypothetical protein NTJ_07020 [Nesidiocoris tenuis]